MVGVQTEGDGRVTAVSYGGASLSKATDGTTTADAILDDGSNDQCCTWWVLPEASLPADGANDVVTTGSGTFAGSSVHFVVLDGCDQGNAFDVVVNAASGTTNPKTGTIDSSGTDGAVLALAGC
jgi:hypothetical protein